MKSLDSYFQKKLESLTVEYGETLFPLEWGNLKDKRCPVCGNRLAFSEMRRMYICKGLKHGKPFVIKEATYIELRKNMDKVVCPHAETQSRMQRN